jgi:hypothetical protein
MPERKLSQKLSLSFHELRSLLLREFVNPGDGEGLFRNEPAGMVNEDPRTDRFRELEAGLENRKMKARLPGIHEVERIGTVDTVHKIEIRQNMLDLSESPAVKKSVLDHIEPMDRDLHGPKPKGSVDLQIVSKSRQISVDSNLVNLASNVVQLKNLLLTIAL